MIKDAKDDSLEKVNQTKANRTESKFGFDYTGEINNTVCLSIANF